MKKKQYVSPRINVINYVYHDAILVYSNVGNQIDYGTGAVKRRSPYYYDFEEDM